MTVNKDWYEEFRNKVREGGQVFVIPRCKGKSVLRQPSEQKPREKEMYVMMDEVAWEIHERNKK